MEVAHHICESNRLVFLLAYEFCIRVGFTSYLFQLYRRQSKSSLMAPKVVNYVRIFQLSPSPSVESLVVVMTKVCTNDQGNVQYGRRASQDTFTGIIYRKTLTPTPSKLLSK